MHTATEIKATVTAVIAALTALWGWFGWLLVLWVVCMVVDYISGTAVACKDGAWASNVARAGIYHKAGMVLVVGVSVAADALIGLGLSNITAIQMPFDYSVLVSPIVVVWYILTELGSIAENAAGLGAPVPAWLLRFLAAAQAATDAAGEIGGNHESN